MRNGVFFSENKSIPKRYGLRHRAAVGITEKTDAVVLVVSEETGTTAILFDIEDRGYVREGYFADLVLGRKSNQIQRIA
jgi:N-acyl-D-aspartate/D-glutamate deacylase